MKTTRRQLLAGLACVPPFLLAGCNQGGALPFQGRLVGPSAEMGHRLRDGTAGTISVEPETTRVAIVGAGSAGLSAAWQLQRRGVTDFKILELEAVAGGTSRSGQSDQISYPWGAHYLPLPMSSNRDLVTLLDEMKVLESVAPDGTPVALEQYLCRDPEERLFYDGQWYEGLYPYEGATPDDLEQLAAFEREVDRFAQWRDGAGRRAFAIPLRESSDDESLLELDRQSMSDWMSGKGLDSSRLRWLVDYSCRDDYGLTVEQSSAWAGLFYFVSRKPTAGESSQPFLTWPEGNGRIISHLSQQVEQQLACDQLVARVERATGSAKNWIVKGINRRNVPFAYEAEFVIFAAPQYVATHVIDGLEATRRNAIGQFGYGAWLVANLTLRDRPEENGFALAWDNVLYDSPSLGYVVATHQRGIDYGPTVWTYYYPFCHDDPRIARQELLLMDWEACAKLVMTDLERAHPNIRSLVDRLDVMRWGHAMIQPRPGFIWGPSRQAMAKPIDGLHFANTDLSGVALFEEAFDHGVRAGNEVAEFIGA